MKKTNAIIIAGFVPTIEAVQILNEIQEAAQTSIPDCDIFYGLNPSKYAEDWIKARPYVNAEIARENLVIASDTSAYQKGLALYKESGNTYDYVWFFHTKGATSGDHYWRQRLIHAIPHDYNRITNILENNPQIGAFGDSLIQLGTYFEDRYPKGWVPELPQHRRTCPTDCAYVLDRFFKLDTQPFEFFYGATWYVIKAFLVDNVLNESFLSTKLDHYYDKGIYFMERDFIHIVDRQGYLLGFNEIMQLADRSRFGERDVPILIRDYKDELNKWAETTNFIGDVMIALKNSRYQ